MSGSSESFRVGPILRPSTILKFSSRIRPPLSIANPGNEIPNTVSLSLSNIELFNIELSIGASVPKNESFVKELMKIPAPLFPAIILPEPGVVPPIVLEFAFAVNIIPKFCEIDESLNPLSSVPI